MRSAQLTSNVHRIDVVFPVFLLEGVVEGQSKIDAILIATVKTLVLAVFLRIEDQVGTSTSLGLCVAEFLMAGGPSQVAVWTVAIWVLFAVLGFGPRQAVRPIAPRSVK
jgi:hypothetical protein